MARSVVPRKTFDEMVSLRDTMDRLFGDSFAFPSTFFGFSADELRPVALDMYEEGDNVVVKAALPGVKPEELKVQVQDNLLTISGESKHEEESKDRKYHLREQRYEPFQRTAILPCAVQVEKAEAVFEHGMLTLTLPKAEGAKSKQIKVKFKKDLPDLPIPDGERMTMLP